jgi:hypothetical protein
MKGPSGASFVTSPIRLVRATVEIDTAVRIWLNNVTPSCGELRRWLI